MEVSFKRKLVITIFATSWIAVLGGLEAFAQPPDVPIYRQGRKESEHDEAITSAAKDIFSSDKAVTLAMVREQPETHFVSPNTAESQRHKAVSERDLQLGETQSFSCGLVVFVHHV